MANGFGRVKLVDIIFISGTWTYVPSDYMYAIAGTQFGSARLYFDPNGSFDISTAPTVEEGPWVSTLFAELPPGFRITSIYRFNYYPFQNPNPAAASCPIPCFMGGNHVGPPFDQVLESWASSLGMTNVSPNWEAIDTPLLMSPFNITINGFTDVAPGVFGIYTTQVGGDPTPGPYMSQADITFVWDDLGPVGPPLGPITDISILPGPNIQFTPPPDATEVLINDVPVAVVPGPNIVPIVGPIVTLIPSEPGPPGPAITVIVDLTMTGALTLGMALDSGLIPIGNPSGIYTLVDNKTHDTLYNRNGGVITTLEVKIPDPFIKTLFLGK